MRSLNARYLGGTVALVAVLQTLTVLALPPGSEAPAASSPDQPLEEAELARLQQAARLRGMALAEMEDGNFGRAEELLGELAEILPDNVLPPINLAICHYRLNQSELALAETDRARRLDPDNPQMLYTLARVLEREPDNNQAWQEVVDHFAATHPLDPRPHYLRALEAEGQGRFAAAVEAFDQALARRPENLVLMVEGLVAAAESGDLDATADALDAIEDRLDGFEGSAADFAEQLRQRIDDGQADAMRAPAQVLRNLLRPGDLYQLGLIPLTGGRGTSGALFPQLDFNPPLPKIIQGGQDIEFQLIDATEPTRLDRASPAVLSTIYGGAERDVLLDVGPSGVFRLEFRESVFESQPVALDPQPESHVLSYDFDQDGVSDLVAFDPRGALQLYRGDGDGGYAKGTEILSAGSAGAVRDLFPLDIDHDGDLDLFIARQESTDLYLQNNGDGSWTERASELGLAGAAVTTSDVAVADFDDDGDLDLLVNYLDQPPHLYLNSLAGAFEDASSIFGLGSLNAGSRAIETADFNNDGWFDLLLWGEGGSHLLINLGDRFERQDGAVESSEGWQAAVVADLDNDSDQDVVFVSLESGMLTMLRNRRPDFEIEPLGLTAEDVQTMTVGDFDHDGDLDLVPQLGDGDLRFWSNDGGNRNQWVKMRLLGLFDNNSKNNSQGLFARLETRVGDTLQTLVANGGTNHIGLGAARQADVVRVVWTNGLPQTWLQVAANQTLVEEQVLKGSCPLLYTWTGQQFAFVTDLMWKSTLGMQLADGSVGSHASARDFVLIPGEQLRPTGGELWLQITEELWETVYIDHQRLLVVDHPESVDLVVDERFDLPPHPREAPVHWLDQRIQPSAARDHLGRDVLDALLQRDDIYVDRLPLSRYQGLTDGHSVELTFDGIPADERLRLLFWGWIFPTDSSINFALTQDRSRELRAPSLELLQADGSWRSVVPFLGFPNGKRKAMVVELTDKLPPGRVTLRIPTSMQIYWDAIQLAVGEAQARAVVTPLEVSAADLHYRGFSRLYRESPSGPHLFDYERVAIGPRFRDMKGAFTRYGPVEELLAAEDDNYVIMNAGDEITIRFDTTALPALPAGWRRDFVLYSDGWVKDADLHTAFPQTVAPLPFHDMPFYPPPRDQSEASTQSQRDFARYQTRQVGDGPFRDAMRQSEAALVALQTLDLVRSDRP